MIASISLTYQLTVVFGGIDMFKGEAIVVGASAGPEPVIPLGGNVGMMFALPGGEPIGLTCGVGIGTGLPVEVFVNTRKQTR